MMGGKAWMLVSAGVAAALSVATPAVAQATPDAASAAGRCAALAGYVSDGLKVDVARLVPAGRAPAEPERPVSERPMIPEHCLIQGTIDKRVGEGGRDFAIGFDLRMPVTWNGRFAFHGGGGMDGRLTPALGDIFDTVDPSALARGFAVISSDGGHRESFRTATFGRDQQARIDYAYNALEKTTRLGKAMVERYYGRKPQYSYMLGCSNGGRQGVVASQRLPLLFDGIVSGDPSLGFSRIALGEMWNVQALMKVAPKDAQGRPIYARAYSDADLGLVRAAVLKQCDAKDGLADGMINDWQTCRFDPAVLQCKPGDQAGCLSAVQVQGLRDLHEGPKRRDGSHIYGPFNYDTGITSAAWRGMRLGTSQTGVPNGADQTLGFSQFSTYQLTPPEPDLDITKPLDFDAMLDRVRYTGAMGDGDSPMIGTFAKRGKMIVYNGLSDQGMASAELAKWYDKVVEANGAQVRQAVRLFLVPGMTHCMGGDATDRFDMLQTIMDWVEKDRAPDRILATSRTLTGISRPLCPYPQVARYRGGDTGSAASFMCGK